MKNFACSNTGLRSTCSHFTSTALFTVAAVAFDSAGRNTSFQLIRNRKDIRENVDPRPSKAHYFEHPTRTPARDPSSTSSPYNAISLRYNSNILQSHHSYPTQHETPMISPKTGTCKQTHTPSRQSHLNFFPYASKALSRNLLLKRASYTGLSRRGLSQFHLTPTPASLAIDSIPPSARNPLPQGL